jgi:hypothetical protein
MSSKEMCNELLHDIFYLQTSIDIIYIIMMQICIIWFSFCNIQLLRSYKILTLRGLEKSTLPPLFTCGQADFLYLYSTFHITSPKGVTQKQYFSYSSFSSKTSVTTRGTLAKIWSMNSRDTIRIRGTSFKGNKIK